MWTPETVTIVFAAFLLGGLVKGATGLALPIVVIAILATTVGLQEAIGLLIVPGIVTNIWQALAGGALAEITRRIWTMMLASVAGIWLGVRVLAGADPTLLICVLGSVLFLYSVISLRRPQIPPPGKRETWLSPLMGLAGGFTFGLTGSYMVPGVLYLQALGMPRDMFVQALGIVFLLIMAALAVFLTRNALFPPEIVILSAAGLVPTALGMFVGQRLRKHLPEERFRKVFFIALCFAGIYMIVRALLTL